MKFRALALASILPLALCLLSACGGRDLPAEGPAPGEAEIQEAEPGAAQVALDPDEEPAVITCRVVDGGSDGELLLAELEGGTGVYRLSVSNIPVTLDGEEADASVLEDGMPIDVSFNGQILETFPAQLGEVYGIAAHSIGTKRNPGGACYDLCGLYLQVLDDLWQKDPALNENIAVAGLDLSQAPGGLTDSEKAALAWRFGEIHGVEVVTGTFEELEEQGYFTSSAISTPAPEEGEDFSHMWNQWEDGCLFSITPNEDHEEESYSLPVLFFNAEKWRAPLAAYCFYDCSAVWPEMGGWSGYTVGAEMIS